MPCYVIRCGSTDIVKIGWATRDVHARVRELQCAHHETLIILRIIDGDRCIEKTMHRHFADQRIRGEWFRFDDAMMSFDPTYIPPIPEPEPLPEPEPPSCDTVPEIIEALGGSGAIRTALGFKHQSRVSNWPHIGIPRYHWPEILDFAAKRGLDLSFNGLRAAEAKLLKQEVAASA